MIFLKKILFEKSPWVSDGAWRASIRWLLNIVTVKSGGSRSKLPFPPPHQLSSDSHTANHKGKLSLWGFAAQRVGLIPFVSFSIKGATQLFPFTSLTPGPPTQRAATVHPIKWLFLTCICQTWWHHMVLATSIRFSVNKLGHVIHQCCSHSTTI